MPSFDIVSEVDMHQLTNAVDQANRVITSRFDFKGVDARFDRDERVVTIVAESEFQVQQMEDILRGTLVKCKIDTTCLELKPPVSAGKHCKQAVTLRHGIDQDTARKIVKLVKDKGLKVQAAIQGDAVRITGKKRDDLQDVIAMLRQQDVGLPLQFNNFRD